MLIQLKDLLTPDEVRQARARLDAQAPWVDGASTAGGQAVALKHNQQLRQDSEASRWLQALVAGALQRDPLFVAAALPRRVLPALFNRYRAQAGAAPGTGDHYGRHVDNAVLRLPGGSAAEWMRGDVSCTLFLSDPDGYDGGELVVEDTYGEHRVKLNAGSLVVYPSGSMHAVAPVTRGERLACYMFMQSMVKDVECRRMLFQMDESLIKLRQEYGEANPELIRLTGLYNNLLRRWTDC